MTEGEFMLSKKNIKAGKGRVRETQHNDKEISDMHLQITINKSKD